VRFAGTKLKACSSKNQKASQDPVMIPRYDVDAVETDERKSRNPTCKKIKHKAGNKASTNNHDTQPAMQ
jgi:hypothetical protein